MRPTVRSLTLFAAALLAAATALAGCAAVAPTCGPSEASCLRILFIGNSYTYVNDLPGTFGQLARAGGHVAQTDSLATGGATLGDHAADPATATRLDSQKWDFVVLQEQSEIPSVEASRQYTMYPAARTLAGMIRQRSETPLFFMTWAHRDGLPASGLPDYETMQRAVDTGYLAISQELDSAVVPVGYTWFVVGRQNPDIVLWQDDGSHPTTAGTYLAACVFYAAIYRASPEGLGFLDGLSAETAANLQKGAAQNVLLDPGEWGLR